MTNPPELVGGHPALDLLNTVEWRGRAQPEDTLQDFTALLSWGRRLGVVY